MVSSVSAPRFMRSIEATGRAHDHVRAALETLELRDVALAAIDRQHMEALQMSGVALKGLRNLDGELSSRHEHECLRAGPR